MTTLLAKTAVLPTITAIRTTIAGDQYTVVTTESTNVVTANSSYLLCTCGLPGCSHICVVQMRRAQNIAEGNRRAFSSEWFDLSYGDLA